ncbi:MAG: hypothetical protein IIB56_08975 [Planctomycetes bacterium]|nr:hypothetical protein [Planctomycetota bacterium]
MIYDRMATDLMIGNFFMVTCPYLFELDTITYFSILRNHHSFQTIARIRGTTQLLLGLHNFEGNFYVHPLKVWNRYSPTMFLPHVQQEEKFISPAIFTCQGHKKIKRLCGNSQKIYPVPNSHLTIITRIAGT